MELYFEGNSSRPGIAPSMAKLTRLIKYTEQYRVYLGVPRFS